MSYLSSATSQLSSNFRDAAVLESEQLPELPYIDNALVRNSALPPDVKHAYLQQLVEIEQKSCLEPITREDMDNWTAWRDLSASFYRAVGTAGILFDTWPPGWQSDFGYVRVDVAELTHVQDPGVVEIQDMVQRMTMQNSDGTAWQSLGETSTNDGSCAQTEALRRRFEAWNGFGEQEDVVL